MRARELGVIYDDRLHVQCGCETRGLPVHDLRVALLDSPVTQQLVRVLLPREVDRERAVVGIRLIDVAFCHRRAVFSTQTLQAKAHRVLLGGANRLEHRLADQYGHDQLSPSRPPASLLYMPSEGGGGPGVNQRSGCVRVSRPFRLLRKGEIQQRLNVAVKAPVWVAGMPHALDALVLLEEVTQPRAAHAIVLDDEQRDGLGSALNGLVRRELMPGLRRVLRRGHRRGFRRGASLAHVLAALVVRVARVVLVAISSADLFAAPSGATPRTAEDQAGEAQGHGQGDRGSNEHRHSCSAPPARAKRHRFRSKVCTMACVRTALARALCTLGLTRDTGPQWAPVWATVRCAQAHAQTQSRHLAAWCVARRRAEARALASHREDRG